MLHIGIKINNLDGLFNPIVIIQKTVATINPERPSAKQL